MRQFVVFRAAEIRSHLHEGKSPPLLVYAHEQHSVGPSRRNAEEVADDVGTSVSARESNTMNTRTQGETETQLEMLHPYLKVSVNCDGHTVSFLIESRGDKAFGPNDCLLLPALCG